MRIIPKPTRQIGAGYALIITMLFVVICMTLLGSMLMWTSTSGKIAARNNIFIQSEAAAEAATEQVFAQMDRDFLYGTLQTNTAYESLIPDTSDTNLWPVQYTFSDPTNNVSNQTYVFESTTTAYEPLDSQYAGLYGDVIDCYITSTATPVSTLYSVPATVSQYLQAADIPIFQFAIFYNINLEFNAASPLTIAGPVFSNAGIWVGGNLTFQSTVQAVGTATVSTDDPFANYTGGSGSSFASTPSSGNNALVMPIAGNATTNSNPTNIEAILNLPPVIGGVSMGAPNSVAYFPSNQIYLFNEADLIISNASWGVNGVVNGLVGGKTGTTVNTEATNITIWFQDQNHSPPLQKLTNDFYILKNPGAAAANLYKSTNILYAGFSFVTNVAFYDFRESDTVQAVQIDIAMFNKWLTNSADEGYRWNNYRVSDSGNGIGSIYVYSSVPISSTALPAVRLVNGSMLPSNYPGLTVASPFPMYVLGNYNVKIPTDKTHNDIVSNTTAYTYPAALMGDSITLLSSNWLDSYTSGTSLSSRPPSANDTVNAAILAGIVQSIPSIASGVAGSYSGGVENFLRLEENWKANPVYYNGSIVVMFPSIYATNYYINVNLSSSYYSAPTRHWAFDNNFKDSTGLPPLTPSAKALIRGQWSGF